MLRTTSCWHLPATSALEVFPLTRSYSGAGWHVAVCSAGECDCHDLHQLTAMWHCSSLHCSSGSILHQPHKIQTSTTETKGKVVFLNHCEKVCASNLQHRSIKSNQKKRRLLAEPNIIEAESNSIWPLRELSPGIKKQKTHRSALITGLPENSQKAPPLSHGTTDRHRQACLVEACGDAHHVHNQIVQDHMFVAWQISGAMLTI